MHPPRHKRIYHYDALIDGRRICRWCGGERGRGSRFYCSTECSDESAIRASSSFARFKVFQRDGGICATCGVDAEAGLRAAKALAARIDRLRYNGSPGGQLWDRMWVVIYGVGRWDESRRFLPMGWPSGHAWVANHILPVYKGGGCCGLENLETLCRACDDAVTAGQSADRARLRRDKKHANKVAIIDAAMNDGQLTLFRG